MNRHRNAKLTVEQCRTFDIAWLRQALRCVDVPSNSGEVSWRGTITWSDPFGRTEAVLGYWLGRATSEGLIVLVDPERTSPFPAAVRLPGEYLIPIVKTAAHIGVRYWFKCPVEHDEKPCGRRVKKLYLPPGEQILGCRVCHELTYRSCQKHDQRRYDLARDPVAMDAALRSKDLRRAGLGIGALALQVREMRKLG